MRRYIERRFAEVKENVLQLINESLSDVQRLQHLLDYGTSQSESSELKWDDNVITFCTHIVWENHLLYIEFNLNCIELFIFNLPKLLLTADGAFVSEGCDMDEQVKSRASEEVWWLYY